MDRRHGSGVDDEEDIHRGLRHEAYNDGCAVFVGESSCTDAYGVVVMTGR